MLQRTLNLGILAHVDAGKTTLTERLLYEAGVIDEVGSVDAGTTQTDSLALERQRGITIKSAVVSFAIGDTTVNLIDTPGHPDFIAEVERVLSVLDGAVLVVSAVEGVQAQTRVLMRALRRQRIPTLIFVNKIDRRGARCRQRVGRRHREAQDVRTVALGAVDQRGHTGGRVRARRERRSSDGRQARRCACPSNDRDVAGRVSSRMRQAPRPTVLRSRLVSQTAASARASRLLRLGDHRGRPRRAHRRDRRAAAGGRWGRRQPVSGTCLQGRARSCRRADRLRASLLRGDPRA